MGGLFDKQSGHPWRISGGCSASLVSCLPIMPSRRLTKLGDQLTPLAGGDLAANVP